MFCTLGSGEGGGHLIVCSAFTIKSDPTEIKLPDLLLSQLSAQVCTAFGSNEKTITTNGQIVKSNQHCCLTASSIPESTRVHFCAKFACSTWACMGFRYFSSQIQRHGWASRRQRLRLIVPDGVLQISLCKRMCNNVCFLTDVFKNIHVNTLVKIPTEQRFLHSYTFQTYTVT